jgi:disulfide bond formation protein DsbB
LEAGGDANVTSAQAGEPATFKQLDNPMNRLGKPLLLLIALASIAMLGVGLYLQLKLDMLPCPLCILQRYGFAAVALIALITVALPAAAMRIGAALVCVASLSGAGVAIRHLWVKAHPSVSCGIDPLETSLNTILPAQWFPSLFQADGLCTTEYEPIFGLSIPAWALIWFCVFALLAGSLSLLQRRDA